MKAFLRLFLFFPLTLLAAESAKNCGCSCCEGKAVCCCHAPEAPGEKPSAEKSQDTAAARHPVRGVVVDVRPEQSALLVKHEAIPGYMRAMTMLFKVDASTLEFAKKGQPITATLVEREDAFYLEDVKPAK